MRIGVIRVEAQRRFEMADGVVDTGGILGEHHAQIVVRFGILRAGAQRGFQMRGGVGLSSGFGQSQPEVVLGFRQPVACAGIFGVEAKSGLVLGDVYKRQML